MELVMVQNFEGICLPQLLAIEYCAQRWTTKVYEY